MVNTLALDGVFDQLECHVHVRQRANTGVRELATVGSVAANRGIKLEDPAHRPNELVGIMVGAMAAIHSSRPPIYWRSLAYTNLGGPEAAMFEPAQKATEAVMNYLQQTEATHV